MIPGLHQGYLLDTNVLLFLLRGKALGERIDRAFGLRGSLHRHAVSIVTQAELSVMADRGSWGPAKRLALERALESVVVIPIDSAELVKAYAEISAAASSAKDFRFLNGRLVQVMWIDPEGA